MRIFVRNQMALARHASITNTTWIMELKFAMNIYIESMKTLNQEQTKRRMMMTSMMNLTRIIGKFKRKFRYIFENTNQELRWIGLTIITFVILFILLIIINAIISVSGTAVTDSKFEIVTAKKSNKDTVSNFSYIISSESSAPVVAEKEAETLTESKPEAEKAAEILTESKPKKVVSTASKKTTEKSTNKKKSKKSEKVTKPITKTKSYTDDDLFYLAAAVCREAGGETDKIQLLVANVIINRVNSSIYPNTIYDVLTQKSQYGTMWKHGISFPNWANKSIRNHCYDIARRILEGERVCPENVLFQAEFAQGSGIYKQFGNDYYFCYY